ncbi:MAG: hypothetical protein VXW87_00020 [Pseudomonadota bacterium]|nr:hypothetical protein [Pseudomonadota bacterium]
MKQTDIRYFFVVMPQKHPRQSKLRTRQMTIFQAFANVEERRKKQVNTITRLYKNFKWQNIPHLSAYKGFKKARFRSGIAYLCNVFHSSIDLVAIDIASQQRVGECEFDDNILSHINVEPAFRRRKIATTFLSLANTLMANTAQYCTSQLVNSRYRLTEDASYLLQYALKKGLVKKDQLCHSPILSPSQSPCYSGAYRGGYNLR